MVADHGEKFTVSGDPVRLGDGWVEEEQDAVGDGIALKTDLGGDHALRVGGALDGAV